MSGTFSVARLLTEVAGVAATAAVGWVGLAYLDVFVTGDVRAWRRLARLRGYARPRSRIERQATQAAIVHRMQGELDLSRLLAIAGRGETPLGFLGRALGYGFAAASLFLGLEGLTHGITGDWLLGLPPFWLFPVGIAASLACVVLLRAEAHRHQAQSERALGDMLMLIAILTDARGLQLDDAVRILSRCVDSRSLQVLVDGQDFVRLVRQPYRSTVELYRAISAEYGIAMFGRLADGAANANIGFSERDVYTRLAKSVYEQRLAEARMRSARAKTLVTIPVAGMLIPLLILLGAPTVASLAGALR
ncbi:MAG: hypothetical protein ABR541_02895 [Candidatus Dormibacteria bacterium]